MKTIKKLLLLSLLIPSVALSESLPKGCYVTFNNPTKCLASPWFISVPKDTSLSSLKAHYGDILGSTLYSFYLAQSGQDKPIEGSIILVGKKKGKSLKGAK